MESGGEGVVLQRLAPKCVTVHFRVKYMTVWGENLMISGPGHLFGSWNVKQGVWMTPLHRGDDLYWQATLSFPLGTNLEYQYVVVDERLKVLKWEGSPARVVTLLNNLKGGDVVNILDTWQDQSAYENLLTKAAYKDVIFAHPEIVDEEVMPRIKRDSTPGMVVVTMVVKCPRTEPGEKVKPWRLAGVAVPVFSIRSRESVGAGEFLDLTKVIDLAASAGFRLVQILPVNDTCVHGMWWDSYPYSSLSVFALHPLYLRLQALSDRLPREIEEEIEAARQELDLPAVDYDRTMEVKLSIARKVYDIDKTEVLGSVEFQRFYEENMGWLRPYACFCFLKNLFGTAEHWKWGLFSRVNNELLDRLCRKDTDYYDSIAFRYFLQFHLHKQLLAASAHARSKRVVLKGDLPIGVDRASVDTWMFPKLFRMHMSTGAPPDYFDAKGQNWGFPTYNWEEMAHDNYAWWRSRLSQMAKYFTAYRIDHILGFFRIWEIPAHGVTGLLGHFRPSVPLTTHELESHGLWDLDRLTKPYVRTHLLKEYFGDEWRDIALHYFNEVSPDTFELRPEVSTEKDICAHLKLRDGSPEWLVKETLHTKNCLLKLIQNVLLLRDLDDPKYLYPRIDIMKNESFEELDEQSKETLNNLYHDYFFKRQDDCWRTNALKTLPVLMRSTDMLVCGEDLGMIPECVPPVLKDLCLLGLRIQRMPNTHLQEFGIPEEYEYMTVCAPSCHDTTTTRAWYEDDPERAQRFYTTVLGLDGPAPTRCEPRIVHAIIDQHLRSPSCWAIFPMQDLMALRDTYTTRPATEETINDPTNPKHYWRFRLHEYIENLQADTLLVGEMQNMLLASGRCKANELPKIFKAGLTGR
eukprot:jgi/Mesvir1/7132/Mv09233-RA.3